MCVGRGGEDRDPTQNSLSRSSKLRERHGQGDLLAWSRHRG